MDRVIAVAPTLKAASIPRGPKSLSDDPWQCNDTEAVKWTDDFTSFGLTVGVDLVRIGPHNIAGFLDLQNSSGSYSGISTGIGYRLDLGSAATPSVAAR